MPQHQMGVSNMKLWQQAKKYVNTHWPGGGATKGYVCQITQVNMPGKQIAMNTISCTHSPLGGLGGTVLLR